MGSETGKQEQASEQDGLHLRDLHLPRDVWSVILAQAGAPLHQVPDGEGLSHVTRWLDLARVCKQ
jgi:hypothetical protein